MKKLTSVLLALIMFSTISVAQVSAAESIDLEGGSGSVPVVLNAEAATFSVTVPASLSISVDKNGVVKTATEAKIVNNGHGAVIVTGIAIAGQGDWTTADYDSLNVQSEKVGTKKVAFEINGEKTIGPDTISFNQENFPKIDGKNDTDTDELNITYNAKVPAQKEALEDEEIVSIIFTIGWFE